MNLAMFQFSFALKVQSGYSCETALMSVDLSRLRCCKNVNFVDLHLMHCTEFNCAFASMKVELVVTCI